MSDRKSSKRPAPLARDPGKEYPDPTPVAVPVRFQQAPSHYDEIKHMIRVAMSDAAQANDMETFEEANDFELDLEDDPEFVSAYEFEDLLPENREAIDPLPLSENMPVGHVSGEAAKTTQPAPAAESAGGTPKQSATPDNTSPASASQ